MPLSPEDIYAAKKAYAQIKDFESNRFAAISYGCLLGLSIIAVGMSSVFATNAGASGSALQYWDRLSPVHFIRSHPYVVVFFLLAMGSVIKYLMHRAIYSESLKITTLLEKKYKSELPFGLENEIEKLKATEKRPLLWRLDAFLSRKPAKT